MSKARTRKVRVWLTVVTAALTCATALFYTLAALFQIVGPSWKR